MSELIEQHKAWVSASARLRGPSPSARVRLPADLRDDRVRRSELVAVRSELDGTQAALRDARAQLTDLAARMGRLEGEAQDGKSITVPSPYSWKRILHEVASETGIPMQSIRSRRRDKATTAARQYAMWRMARETNLSMSKIGGLFGGRDHTTVLYSIEKHEERMRGERL